MSGGEHGEHGERYRAFPEGMRFAAGSQDQVVIDPLSGRPLVLSLEQGRVLSALRGEDTLDGHAARVAGGEPGQRGVDGARALVETLVHKGLLVSGGALRGMIARAAALHPAPRGPAAIGMLGVPTNGRADGLVACLRSHAAAARAHGRRVVCVVADSAVGEAAAATRDALVALAADDRMSGMEIRYAGRGERERFCEVLALAAATSPTLVRFALFGDPRFEVDTGANRNALLLDGAGEALLMVDDDVRARTAPPPARSEGLGLVSGDPNEAWFPDPGAAPVAEEGWETPDPFALHETLLGADVARVAAGQHDGMPADLRRAGAGFFRRLVRRGGRVVTTQLGGAGDHGMGASFGLLLLGGASHERLVASEARFRDAFTRRWLVRSATRPSIGDTSFCMSMSLGLDARELLPPFAPVGRDSDGLFGLTVRACVGDAFAGFVPRAVEHVPLRPRTASFEHEKHIAGQGGVNEHLRMAIAAAFEARDVHTEAHLRHAGEVLCRLAERPRDAEHFFREQTMRGLSRRLAQIERQLAERGRRPAFWAQALDGFAAALRSALADPTAYLPAELLAAHGEPAARALFLDHVTAVGHLFTAWPALFEAARELRARGVRLSIPVTPP